MKTVTKIPAADDANDLEGELAEVFAYWDSARAGGIGPTWKSIQLVDLAPMVIPWCSVVDVVLNPIDFRFRFWGSARTNLQGHDLTGHSVNELIPDGFAKMVFRQNVEVTEGRAPLLSITTFEKEKSQTGVYRFLRLPLSNDGENVTGILTTSSHDEGGIREMHKFFGTVPTPKGLL